jgi:hypothetical protein
MNLTFDLPIVVGTHPRKARESRVREMARRGRDMTRTRSVHSQSKQQGSDKEEEAETLLNLHKQYIGLYSGIAKRMGVDASYVSRVANGEYQSEKLRCAFLSELGLIQGVA